jgi:hypothetical protein
VYVDPWGHTKHFPTYNTGKISNIKLA